MGYNYNGKLRSAEVLLKEDGSHQLIRRAETPPITLPRWTAPLTTKNLSCKRRGQ